MASASTSEHDRDGLLKHVDDLFALAQVVTSDAEEAVQVVGSAFRRAFTAPDLPSDPAEQRVWLFHALLQEREERSQAAASGEGHAVIEREPAKDVELADFRRRLAAQFVVDHLPSAYASLPSEYRVLLMLCDVQGMNCEEAGRVLTLEDERACAQLDDARAALRLALYKNASEVERHLLDTGLPGDWRQQALRRMAESELVAAPPTLMSSILATGEHVRIDRRPAVITEPATESKHASSWLGLARRAAIIVVMILVAGLLGYAFTNLTNRQPNANLITLSASQAAGVEINFQTSSAEQAERYIRDRLQRRVMVPNIDQAVLEGVAIGPIVEGASVPALVYRDEADDSAVTVYLFSYAFLDRHESRLILARDVLQQIEEEGRFDLHDLGNEKALIWRRQDDILVAITSGDAEALRDRISYPS